MHDGLSVRGGYPVEQKRMKQWLLRVTAYAQRMLDGLDKLEWSDSLKEIQRNSGSAARRAPVFFDIENSDRETGDLHHPSRHDLRRDVCSHRPEHGGSAKQYAIQTGQTPP